MKQGQILTAEWFPVSESKAPNTDRQIFGEGKLSVTHLETEMLDSTAVENRWGKSTE